MMQFVDQRRFRELAAVGDTVDVGVERPARAIRANEESRTVRFVLSDSSVDRMGDTIDAAGWRLGQYKANPVVLWSHLRSEPRRREADTKPDHRRVRTHRNGSEADSRCRRDPSHAGRCALQRSEAIAASRRGRACFEPWSDGISCNFTRTRTITRCFEIQAEDWDHSVRAWLTARMAAVTASRWLSLRWSFASPAAVRRAISRSRNVICVPPAVIADRVVTSCSNRACFAGSGPQPSNAAAISINSSIRRTGNVLSVLQR
jgi:hypothetical protein